MNVEVKNVLYTRDGKEYPISFYTDLTIRKKVIFIKSVVDLVVDEDYLSIIRDIVFDYMIIYYFTDFDTTEVSESDDSLTAMEKLLEETNIVELVKKSVSKELLTELSDAVDRDIEYKTGIKFDNVTTALSKLMKVLTDKIENTDMSELVSVAKKLSGQRRITSNDILDAYRKSSLKQSKQAESVTDDKEVDKTIKDEKPKRKVKNSKSNTKEVNTDNASKNVDKAVSIIKDKEEASDKTE